MRRFTGALNEGKERKENIAKLIARNVEDASRTIPSIS